MEIRRPQDCGRRDKNQKTLPISGRVLRTKERIKKRTCLGMLPLGERRGTRTPDTQIKSLLFCHLNYTLIQLMLRSGRLAPQHLYYITLCVICQQVFRNFFILFIYIPKGYLRNSLDNFSLARSMSDNRIGGKANDRTDDTNSNEKNQFTHFLCPPLGFGSYLPYNTPSTPPRERTENSILRLNQKGLKDSTQ